MHFLFLYICISFVPRKLRNRKKIAFVQNRSSDLNSKIFLSFIIGSGTPPHYRKITLRMQFLYACFRMMILFFSSYAYSSYKLCIKCVILDFRTEGRVSEPRAYYPMHISDLLKLNQFQTQRGLLTFLQ